MVPESALTAPAESVPPMLMPKALLKLMDVPAVMVPASASVPVPEPKTSRLPNLAERKPTVRPELSSSAKSPAVVKPVSVLMVLPWLSVSVALPEAAVRLAAVELAPPVSVPARMTPPDSMMLPSVA